MNAVRLTFAIQMIGEVYGYSNREDTTLVSLGLQGQPSHAEPM